MTSATFQAIVERLEKAAAKSPGLYRFKVALLAAMGYLYLLGALLVAAAALAALVYGMVKETNVIAWKLALPLLVVITAILRALFVRIKPPQGAPVPLDRVPRLREMVKTIGKKLDAPPVHVVLATGDLNAAIVQVPRLGILGWQRNYLIIGLPLLQAVTPDEWRAVLAHEMGHLSGNHGRFASWIYRLRLTWGRLLQIFEKERSRLGKLLVGRFVEWYAPYFAAWSFVLARSHEYEADRAAADVVGATTAAQALMRIEAAARFLNDRFWRELYNTAATNPDPPADMWPGLRAALGQLDTNTAQHFVADAWRRPTDYSDTHPALADRVSALLKTAKPAGAAAAPPPPPPPLTQTAAAQFLGPVEQEMENAFGKLWRDQVAGAWRKRHQEIAQFKKRLDELTTEAGTRELSGKEQWERLTLLNRLGDEPALAHEAKALLERQPDHSGALFYTGRALLDTDEAKGVELIERAMQKDADAILPGCEILFNHFWSHGDRVRAEHYRATAEGRQEVSAAAKAERLAFRGSVKFTPTDLSPEVRAKLALGLKKMGDVKQAWIANRVVRIMPEVPCRVLAIVVSRGTLKFQSLKYEIGVRTRIAQSLSIPNSYVILLNRTNWLVRRRLRKAGTRLF